MDLLEELTYWKKKRLPSSRGYYPVKIKKLAAQACLSGFTDLG